VFENLRFLEVELGFKKNSEEPFKRNPVCVVVGDHALPKALDQTLEKSSVGDEAVITLTPENSFGFRKPDLVKVVNLNIFKKQKVNPVPGMIFFFDGVPGKVKSVSGGRAVVDFNLELAGETLDCSFKILKEFSTDEEKVKGFGEKLGKVDFREDVVILKLNGNVNEDEKQKFNTFVTKYSGFKKVEFK
jgi:FKBP-type peptidyl-prolyl cis-trans isomerase 2